ncbi:MAG: GNAT family N-acetyltransferase [Anaerorhabdus sp.]|uniref:GNAT family N-acetyltransferase n=1 Tax=Anaerorhabdus sp. TaxID=1872524 RepID=UPI002FCAFB16
MIIEIKNEDQKERITRSILDQLPDWFGIQEAIDEYAIDSRQYPFWIASENEKTVGFISLKETSPYTCEIYVIGVLPDYHGRKIGTQLFEAFKSYAKEKNYSFIQVKTVKQGIYSYYDKTNQFYQHLGFKELEAFPKLWDEKNVCQIYIQSI